VSSIRCDFTILNRRVATERLGHAFSVHGLSGNLGWAAAPVFMAGIAGVWNWHVSGFAAGLVATIVLALVIWQRDLLHVPVLHAQTERGVQHGPQAGAFAFLSLDGGVAVLRLLPGDHAGAGRVAKLRTGAAA
jgi:MFS family permease